MTETIAGSLLFLRLESTAGRKRRGPAKPAPQSIPSPLVRNLVAWVAPSAVLRASAEIVGRRASLFHTLLLACCDYEEEWAIRVRLRQPRIPPGRCTSPEQANDRAAAAAACTRACLWPVAPSVRDQRRVEHRAV